MGSTATAGEVGAGVGAVAGGNVATGGVADGSGRGDAVVAGVTIGAAGGAGESSATRSGILEHAVIQRILIKIIKIRGIDFPSSYRTLSYRIHTTPGIMNVECVISEIHC